MRSRSPRVSTPPVGLCGELITMTLVFARDAAFELVEIEAPVARLRAAEPACTFASQIARARRVCRISGIGVDDLVARIEQRRKHVPDDRLRAGADDDVLGVHSARCREAAGVLGDRVAQFGNAGRGRVVRVVLVRSRRSPARLMCSGVSKSGSPISMCTTWRPCASSSRARANTSKAFSVPRRRRRRRFDLRGLRASCFLQAEMR